MTIFVICVGSSLLSKATDVTLLFNFWWLAKWSKQQKSIEMQKKAP